MKRTIDGKTYNTKTAEIICDTGNDESLTDFRYERSDLFVTRRGRYFVAGRGGSLSRFAVPDGNGRRGGAGIIPLTRDAAFAEIQHCAGYNTGLITKYFGDTGQKVPCPVCHGNGYVEKRPKEVRNCYFCHSQGEVTWQKRENSGLLWRY